MGGEIQAKGTLRELGEREVEHLEALLVELGRAAGAHRFEVAPNPCVGAAVLSDGVEIGRGFHREWGGPHAEIQALEAAAASGVPRERWDTLVVTLEPCCSHGKTPPCTEAILREPFRRVVVGALDPDPRHRGRGLEELRERGLDVVVRNVTPLERVAPHFVEWTRPDRLRRSVPWVVVKWAQTRSGQLTPPRNVGGGRWITGHEALEDVHRLRARVDAIVTGVGTVLTDDPRLSVRPPAVALKAPLRVVLDTELSTPHGARLFLPDAPGESSGPVHIVTVAGTDPVRHRELSGAGATIHTLHPGDDGHPSLRETLGLLWNLGARRVMLEAGPRLVSSFFAFEYIDQLRVYTGNVNGGEGPSLARHLVPERLLGIEHSEIGDAARLQAFVKR